MNGSPAGDTRERSWLEAGLRGFAVLMLCAAVTLLGVPVALAIAGGSFAASDLGLGAVALLLAAVGWGASRMARSGMLAAGTQRSQYPLPRFEREHGAWRATIVLDCWRGYQSRRGAYGGVDSAVPSNGSVDVRFDARADDAAAGPTPADLESLRWLVEHQREQRQAVLDGLRREYEALRAMYAEFVDDAQELPPLAKVDDFRGLIGLHALHIHRPRKEGMPYVGFEFGCTWDVEHGLGAMVHGTRVIEIGQADRAFDTWIVKRDR